jgi:hypothetical protein
MEFLKVMFAKMNANVKADQERADCNTKTVQGNADANLNELKKDIWTNQAKTELDLIEMEKKSNRKTRK